jgi:hypothetical protein
MPNVPQFKLPLTVAPNGDFVTVEQGDTTDLIQRVAVIVKTPPGWVPGAADVGLYDQAFLEGGADVGEIERQIATYVPGAEQLVLEDLAGLNGALDPLNVRIGPR